MTFEIIPSQQTPKTAPIMDVGVFLDQYGSELDAFLAFAKSHPRAAALAANQCNLNGERFNFRVFAISSLKYKNPKLNEWQLIINPQVTENIGICEQKAEGCLTWGPSKKILAYRHRAIRVSYWTMDGSFYNSKFLKGFEAQVFQHEIAHLDGDFFDVREAEVEEPKPADAGRNEPCPCGSKKKYKQCCLTLID